MIRSPTSIVAVLLTAVFFIALGQGAVVSNLGLGQSDRWGAHLVDADGLTVYAYVQDQETGSLACVDSCANNWPPVLVVEGAAIPEGLDPALVGQVERPDGSQQVTYGGLPLYRSMRDNNPGDTRGQAVGKAFFLVGPAGSMITEEPAAETEVDAVLVAELMAEGADNYRAQCSVCHNTEGQGLVGPGLAGMPNLASTDFILTTILGGRTGHGMPAFGPILDDRQIASIATFVRSSWGNEFGVVTPEEVTALR